MIADGKRVKPAGYYVKHSRRHDRQADICVIATAGNMVVGQPI
jgi:hypothetical protein